MAVNGDIMTLSDVALYLKIAEKSVLRMVRRGELPGTKVASQWRFLRSVIDGWLLERMKSATGGDGDTAPGLSRMLRESCCLLDLTPGSKADVLLQLVQPLRQLGEPIDAPHLVERLLDRENMLSTGIGHGVALPHLRNPAELRPMQACLVFGRCRTGIDFHAIDGEPVTLFFLPRPLNDVHHVHLMARLGALLREPENRRALNEAETYRDVERLLLKHDQNRLLASRTSRAGRADRTESKAG